ncbi:GNAT family N-acetyltransferase [Streptomyces sp. JNUCC 63]
MTAHLGGPEDEDQLTARHRRYLAPEAGRMYRVVRADDGETVGATGFWERAWRGGTAWETGWGGVPRLSGAGAGGAGGAGRRGRGAGRRRHRYPHAFPKTEHAASDAVCRRAGFTLLGPVDFEYPKGGRITSNDWRVDLAG